MPDSLTKPPARVVEGDRWLPRSLRSPSRARALLREVLSRAKDGDRHRQRGELLISELVTNAVVHGARAGTLIYVTVQLRETEGVLRIEVHDIGEQRPMPRQARSDAESGRGLLLVESLSLRWGCCPRGGPDTKGKIVWCESAPDVALTDSIPDSSYESGTIKAIVG